MQKKAYCCRPQTKFGARSCFCSPQRSCEGYVITGVCLSTGGCLVPGGPSPGGGVPSPGGGLLPGGLVLGGGLVPGGPGGEPPKRDGHCCRRYASYWNAFLLLMSVILSTSGQRGGGSLYDVTSCLAAWSHVPSGGSLCLWSHVPLRGSLSKEGLPDRDPSRQRPPQTKNPLDRDPCKQRPPIQRPPPRCG